MQANKQASTHSYGSDHLRFFDVDQPFTISTEEFKIKWNEVNNVWTQVGQTKKLAKDPLGWMKTYDCHFKKCQTLSTKDPNQPVEK